MCGMVAQVGDEVTDFKVGDRVAIEPGEPCRECEYVNQDNIIYVHIWNLWRHHHTMVRSVNM